MRSVRLQSCFSVFFAPIFGALFLFSNFVYAVDPAPGAACAINQERKFSGGPELSGFGHWLVCVGGFWQASFTSDGSALIGIGTTSVATGARMEIAGGALRLSEQSSAFGGEIQFAELLAQGTNTVALRARGTLASSLTWLLPDTLGTAGNVMTVGAGGTLYWSAPVGGISYPVLSTTLGSAATPAYSFSADNDTGIYSPGTGTLAISTNGTLRLNIDSSGNIGIGTASPSFPLHYIGSGTEIIKIESNNALRTALEIGNTSAGAKTYKFENTGSGNVPGNFHIYDVSADRSVFAIKPGGDVALTSANVLGFVSNAAFAYSYAIDTSIGRSAAGVLEVNNGTLGVYRDLNVRSINPSIGGLGIGTTAVRAGTKLEVTGGAIAAGNGGELRMMENLSQGTNFVAFKARGTLGSDLTWLLPDSLGTSGQTLTVGSGGTLYWSAPGGSVTYPLLSTTRGSVATPAYSFSSDTTTGIYSPGAGSLAFSTNGTSRISIDPFGSIGIGTLIPSHFVEVRRDSAAATNLIVTNAGGGYAAIGVSDGGPTTKLQQLGAFNAFLGSEADNFSISSYDRITFNNTGDAAEYMRIRTDNGEVSIGTTAVRSGNRLEVTGGAIAAGNGGELRMMENLSQGTNYVAFKARGTLGSDLTWLLPDSLGTAGQTMTVGSGGTLYWSTPGGLSNFTESVSSTGVNAGRPVVALVATNALGTVDVAIVPKGIAPFIGALTAQIPDGAVANGNKRGVGAIDWQTERALATQVASGQNAVIGGGRDNLASGLNTTIAGGRTNIADDIYAGIAAGRDNRASGTYSFVGGGEFNSAWADHSTVSGGQSNKAFGLFATVTGGSFSNAYGLASTAGGLEVSANTFAETAFGAFNSIIGSGTSSWVPTEPLFVIGNGTGTLSSQRSNALTLLKNGNLGLGTTAVQAGAKLEVYGGAIKASAQGAAAGNGGEIRMGELMASGTNFVAFRAPDALAANLTWTLPSVTGTSQQVLSTNGTGTLSWLSVPVSGGILLAANGNAGTPGIAFSADPNVGFFSPGANTLGISINGTERVRINSSGFVGIGTSTPNTPLHVVGDITFTGLLVDASDVRLKENIQDLGSGLEMLRQIHTYSYNMKSDPEKKTEFGVLAHQVQKISPYLVRSLDSNSDLLGVNYLGFIPFSIKAIQELDQYVRRLESRNQFLSDELIRLQSSQHSQQKQIDLLVEKLDRLSQDKK